MTKVPGGWGGWWAPEARNPGTTARVFRLPPQKTQYKHHHGQRKQKAFRKNPLGDPINRLCRLEAPVNDKATEKHHWPGPG